MEKIIGSLLILGIITALNVFMFKMLWYGIRSIMKKTINLPPSHARWARMRAEVIPSDEVKHSLVRYHYENVEYTAFISDYTIYGSKAMIYVKRSNPKVVKEFIPRPPMSVSAAFAYFFIAGMILLIDYVMFSVE